jgi:hypothetical protein
VQAAENTSGTGFYNKRYCEILELEGLPPDATITVWNTAGLNDCPQAAWKALDAAALAQELGDTALILNGPRYFLMDETTSETGGIASFQGLHMQRVATIAVHTPEQLAPTPYTEHSISRVNTWT